MKFSILIPVYNVEKYLRECLNSVLSQTFNEFECILTDDGSTDSSGDICDEYVCNYPSIFRVIHKQNEGLISARRVGISEAKGEYCVFLDSDDSIIPEALEIINSYIKKFVPDIVLYSFVYNNDGVLSHRNKHLFADETVLEADGKIPLYESFISGPDYFAIWTKAIKTSILKSDSTDYKQFYGKNMSEDVLQSLYPITSAQRIVFADRELVKYRFNPSSLSNLRNINDIEKKNTLHVTNEMLKYLPLWFGDKADIKKSILHNYQFSYMMYQLRSFYKAVPLSQRLSVLKYDWTSFLPSDFSLDNIPECKNKEYFKRITRKQYLRCIFPFEKDIFYKKICKYI